MLGRIVHPAAFFVTFVLMLRLHLSKPQRQHLIRTAKATIGTTVIAYQVQICQCPAPQYRISNHTIAGKRVTSVTGTPSRIKRTKLRR